MAATEYELLAPADAPPPAGPYHVFHQHNDTGEFRYCRCATKEEVTTFCGSSVDPVEDSLFVVEGGKLLGVAFEPPPPFRIHLLEKPRCSGSPAPAPVV